MRWNGCSMHIPSFMVVGREIVRLFSLTKIRESDRIYVAFEVANGSLIESLARLNLFI